MKKILLTCLNIVLAVLVVAAGTITYLKAKISSDMKDSLAIYQTMWQRDEKGNLEKISENEDTDEIVFVPMITDLGQMPTESVTINQNQYSFLSDPNAVDKIVTVTNNGTVGAYVRTVFAFEADTSKIVLQKNETDWTWTSAGPIEIDGTKYDVWVAVYNGILAGNNTTTPPSLLQVGMLKDSTNAYSAQFGQEYEIRVYSQAVQSSISEYNGLSAEATLNNIFGTISATNHPWLKDTDSSATSNQNQQGGN